MSIRNLLHDIDWVPTSYSMFSLLYEFAIKRENMGVFDCADLMPRRVFSDICTRGLRIEKSLGCQNDTEQVNSHTRCHSTQA